MKKTDDPRSFGLFGLISRIAGVVLLLAFLRLCLSIAFGKAMPAATARPPRAALPQRDVLSVTVAPRPATRWAKAGGLAFALLVFAAVVGLLLSVVLTKAPVFGYRAVMLSGGSMEPALDNGSLLIAREVDPADLAVGDVITFRYPGSKTAVTHRIVAIEEKDGRPLFTTKGDKNATPDGSYVTFDSGKPYRLVFSIPHAGRLLAYLDNAPALILAGVVTLATLFALDLVEKDERKRRARAESPVSN